MSAHLYSHKISYFSVPKCACTTLKRFFFQIENGFEFQNFRIDHHLYHIHQFYLSRPFAESAAKTREDHAKFALIRDPVSRLVSCYRNRVDSEVGRKEMRAYEKQLRKENLPLHPTWPEFLEYIENYRSINSSIKHHSEPLTYFLGQNPDYFDRIFSIQEIDTFRTEIKKIVGHAPNLGKFQTEGSKFDKDGVTDEDRKRIHAFLATDYDFFDRYF